MPYSVCRVWKQSYVCRLTDRTNGNTTDFFINLLAMSLRFDVCPGRVTDRKPEASYRCVKPKRHVHRQRRPLKPFFFAQQQRELKGIVSSQSSRGSHVEIVDIPRSKICIHACCVAEKRGHAIFQLLHVLKVCKIRTIMRFVVCNVFVTRIIRMFDITWMDLSQSLMRRQRKILICSLCVHAKSHVLCFEHQRMNKSGGTNQSESIAKRNVFRSLKRFQDCRSLSLIGSIWCSVYT